MIRSSRLPQDARDVAGDCRADPGDDGCSIEPTLTPAMVSLTKARDVVADSRDREIVRAERHLARQPMRGASSHLAPLHRGKDQISQKDDFNVLDQRDLFVAKSK
jgi:hypothetical protein